MGGVGKKKLEMANRNSSIDHVTCIIKKKSDVLLHCKSPRLSIDSDMVDFAVFHLGKSHVMSLSDSPLLTLNNVELNLSQMTEFKLSKTERVCRRQFHI